MSCKDLCYFPTFEKPLCNCESTPSGADNTKFNMSVLPSTYQGDIIINGAYQFSAVCRVGDTIYSLCHDVNSDNGYIYAHSVATNSIVVGYPKAIVVGHGNGLCYIPDTNSFLIAPVFHDSTGARWYALIEYNANWDSYTVHNVDVSIMSVSHDWVNNKTYAYGYNGKIYRFNNGVLTEVITVARKTYQYDINQGFAVNDGYFILTSPLNNLLIGKLSDGIIFTEKMVDVRDYSKKYYLGESEDLEFDKDGNLYCMRNIYLNTSKNIVNGIVTNIIYDNAILKPFYIGNMINGSYTLNDSSIVKFKNSDIEIKHPMQMNYIIYNDVCNTLIIDVSNTDFEYLYFNVPLTINLKGNFIFTRITTVKDLTFFSDTPQASHIIINNGTGTDIFMYRGSRLWICDEFTYIRNNASVGNYLKIGFGNFKSLISIRTKYKVAGEGGAFVDTTVMQIGDSTSIKDDCRGLWWGSKLVTDIQP